jgi:hypothetical protein
MLLALTGVLAGTVGGAVAGAVASWRVVPSRAADNLTLDPRLESEIDAASRQWATAHGQPAAAPLIADKLRLAYVLSQRSRHRRRRWSR